MIRVEHVSARFGEFALQDICLHVRTGQYCVLLGPPGSGKTSIVEIICGLRPAQGGSMLLDGKSLAGLDPADRHVGYVPQDYALFPTLDVFGNIAFGLTVRRLPAGDIARRVGLMAERLGIAHLLERSCRGLSGGERQRVALARALVLEPKVLLLDEPVAALDELSRQQVCLELRGLHDAMGMTTIHISHNFEETRSVADVVGVLRAGRLAQWGAVAEVFRAPASAFVARFVRAGNVLCGLGGAAAPCVLLRPQDAALAAGDAGLPPGRLGLRGTILAIQDSGGLEVTVRVKVAIDGHPDQIMSVAILRQDDQPPPWLPGQAVAVHFDPARLLPLADDSP